jgi:hypothetical protein
MLGTNQRVTDITNSLDVGSASTAYAETYVNGLYRIGDGTAPFSATGVYALNYTASSEL